MSQVQNIQPAVKDRESSQLRGILQEKDLREEHRN